MAGVTKLKRSVVQGSIVIHTIMALVFRRQVAAGDTHEAWTMQAWGLADDATDEARQWQAGRFWGSHNPGLFSPFPRDVFGAWSV